MLAPTAGYRLLIRSGCCARASAVFKAKSPLKIARPSASMFAAKGPLDDAWFDPAD
jgi:hypothetical protein